ncbi:IS630 family transposase [Pleurocapsales cyanobacterium LEGE 10410]|nr:IS630 family transposase [Pleurocapsales cyanobacterium LEGE 10410]
MERSRRDKVLLDSGQRERLEKISHNGYAPIKKILHAQVLLMCDEGNQAQRKWTDEEISSALNIHLNSVVRIRKRFLQQGIEPSLNRRHRICPPNPLKLNGEQEAQLIALCCSSPPEGRVHWSLRLLTKELKTRVIVTEISHPKKNQLCPWKKQRFRIPERDLAHFVAEMEVVLDIYSSQHSYSVPLICMDEAAVQLTEPIQMQPSRDAEEDYYYTRESTQALFVFFDPNTGWRRVTNRDSRTSIDWAEEIRQLLEVDYPQAEKVKLVCNNLNTHNIASLYKAFPAPKAHRLARRLEIYYTPRNGSWLNVAKTELSVLSQQCLTWRIPTSEKLTSELNAWAMERNHTTAKVIWRFATQDARIKLKYLYPTFETVGTDNSNALVKAWHATR